MKIIALALLCATLGGCASFSGYSDYDGIGAAENSFKSGMKLGAEEAACTNPHLLFKPDGCYAFCGSIANPGNGPQLISMGVDGFYAPAQRAMGPTLTDANECLRQCHVNMPFVQKCVEEGAWKPNKTVWHRVGFNNVQNFDNYYDYQRLAVAMISDEPGNVETGTQQNEEAAARVLNGVPAVDVVEHLWADAAQKPVIGMRHVSADMAQAITTPDADERLFCNPAGVQWQQSFDGNITVDQQVN
jgi:hypothetical protein